MEEIMLRFWRDLKGHYRYAIFSAKAALKSEVASSYLNWIWWILEPFCFMLIYAFIFGVVFNAKEPHFGVFIFIGLTAWNFFSRCLTQSVKILRVNKSIVTKVYIPKFILLISRMFFNGYKMLISFGIIAVMLVYYRIPLTLNVLYLPLVFLVHCVTTFACMTFLMHYGVFVQDLQNVTDIALRMLMYLSGIFYNLEKRMPGRYGVLLAKINPLALILTSYRRCLIYGQMPDVKWLMIWLLLSAAGAAIGMRIIYKNENSYVKVI